MHGATIKIINLHSCSGLLTLWRIKPTTIPREGTNGPTTVSVYVLRQRHTFRAKYTQFVLRPTPKAAHNKTSNTRTVLIVHTVVSLPEGFRSCLSSICCGDSDAGPSTDGLLVTSVCNRVQTARKICAKNAFLSLAFFPLFFCFFLIYYTVWYSMIQYDTVRYSTIQYDTVWYSTIQYDTVRYSMIQYDTVWYSPLRLQMQHFTISVSTFCFHAQFCHWPTPLCSTTKSVSLSMDATDLA